MAGHMTLKSALQVDEIVETLPIVPPFPHNRRPIVPVQKEVMQYTVGVEVLQKYRRNIKCGAS
jgi:hypothetical protein